MHICLFEHICIDWTLKILVSDDGCTVKSLGALDFVVNKDIEGKMSHQFFDKNHPLSIKIFPNQNTNTNSFSLTLEEARGDAILLLRVIEFLQSLNDVKKLKITDTKSRKESIADIKSDKLFQFEERLLSLVKTLAFIPCKTGQMVRDPENPESFNEL